jgi:type II secretory pathway component PulF
MVVDLSEFMQQWIVVILIGMGATVFGFFFARRRSRQFRYRTDAFLLKTPVFGPLLRKVAVARFSRTLGTMISSGVPILEALDIRAHGRQPGDRGGAREDAGRDLRGQDHRRAARGIRRVPGHGGADDRRG